MKRAEAEKLLGGYAAGNLTETERRALFEAALEHQDLFDALADEEALRELLADPAARAHVLAALAPAPPRIVPFWRRPGVIGAAAGIIMAATAGLAVLRSPEAQGPLPAAKQEAAQAPLPAPSASAPAAPEAKVMPPPVKMLPAEKAAVPHPAVAVPASESPAPVAQVVAAQAGLSPAADGAVRAEARQAEARDQLSRKVEAAARNEASAVLEVARAAPAPAPSAGSAPPPRVAAKAAAPPTTGLHAPQAPIWTLESLADGSTRLTVMAFRQAQVVLLRRGASGVEVLKPATAEDAEPWQFHLRLAPGDVLDLYVLDRPVSDPARLPETGPVDGFRARIHPPAKKSPPR